MILTLILMSLFFKHEGKLAFHTKSSRILLCKITSLPIILNAQLHPTPIHSITPGFRQLSGVMTNVSDGSQVSSLMFFFMKPWQSAKRLPQQDIYLLQSVSCAYCRYNFIYIYIYILIISTYGSCMLVKE